jgi:putative transposase
MPSWRGLSVSRLACSVYLTDCSWCVRVIPKRYRISQTKHDHSSAMMSIPNPTISCSIPDPPLISSPNPTPTKKRKYEQKICRKEKESLVSTGKRTKSKSTKRQKVQDDTNHAAPSVSSSQTLEQTSTGKEHKLTPFWNSYTTNETKRWWLPTGTGCADLKVNGWNGIAKNLSAKSWYTTKIMKSTTTISQNENWSAVSALSVEIGAPVATEEKGIEWKARLIRLLPTKNQDTIFRQWVGAARWIYNQCLAAWNQKQVCVNGQPTKVEMNKKFFRSWCLNSNSELFKQNPWLKQVPYDVRDEAMNDFLKAYKSTMARLQKGSIKQFKMQFRSKKHDDSSISVLKKHWKKNKLFPTVLGKKPIKSTEPISDKLPADTRMIRTRTGKYYLCLLQPLDVKAENQSPLPRALVLDPGVRTFLTGYDPSGFLYEWGAKDIQRICRLQLTMDTLQSKWMSKDTTHKKRYKMKKAWTRIQERIKNLIKDIHRKCIKWMVENFTLILLPLFQTSKMARKEKRKINKKTTRQMLSWSHFHFRQLLLSKVREYPWCRVVICDESYTSKICGNCGHLHNKLGGNKTFRCPMCNYVSDRDHNASRNIWLKYLTDNDSKKTH